MLQDDALQFCSAQPTGWAGRPAALHRTLRVAAPLPTWRAPPTPAQTMAEAVQLRRGCTTRSIDRICY